jgi:putative nucleotidyltransferase with HDIG domain
VIGKLITDHGLLITVYGSYPGDELMWDNARKPHLKTLLARSELSRFVDQLNAISPLPLLIMDADNNVIYGNGSTIQATGNKSDLTDDLHQFPIEFKDTRIGTVVWCGSSELQRLVESLDRIGEMLTERLDYELKIDSLASEMVDAYQELSLLHDLSGSLSSVLEVEAICHILLKQAVDIIGAKSSVVMLLEPEGEQLTATASAGISRDLGRIEVKGSIYETVIQSKTPLVIEDLEKYPHFKGKINEEEIPMICVPVCAGDEAVGLISMWGKSSGKPFTSEDTKLLCAIASQAGMSLGNARLHEELNGVLLNTVESLAAAIEAKDLYTHGHCRRVAEYSTSMAQEIGLPAKEIADLRLAGILHDIGKIGVSDSILKKPGELNSQELKEIRSHPVKGAEIIEHIESMSNIALWIRHHHERYDGTGYPDGLNGEDIPLHSRILAVADAYDALTSNRSYNPRYPYYIPLAKLRMDSGSHFDPEIVDVFLDLARQRAYEKYIEDYEKSNSRPARKLTQLEYYRMDNEIIRILVREAKGDPISISDWKRLQELRDLVLTGERQG